ncbi:hypothetical protein [Amycolatopsis acididurans]|uniref:hypothetical protein n=1 Tax=Amycolatopsis acididurans TaxID=2724524 RepID=UPI001FEB8B66|nr:hypothetical protein [Amycolatopsis acididurans]
MPPLRLLLPGLRRLLPLHRLRLPRCRALHRRGGVGGPLRPSLARLPLRRLPGPLWRVTGGCLPGPLLGLAARLR